jgi:hypothetical protein
VLPGDISGIIRGKTNIMSLEGKVKRRILWSCIAGINDFKRGYQSRNNIVKDTDLLANSHNILNRLKKFFCQLLHVHGVSDARQAEIHTAEPLISHDIIVFSTRPRLVK